MSTPYIAHTTITTGHTSRSMRADVADEVLQSLRPLIADGLASGQPIDIPHCHPYRAQFLRDGGALLCTVTRQPDIGQGVPVVTFGVAARSRDATMLWDLMIKAPGDKSPGLKQPGAPFCAVIIHPTAPLAMEAFEWLGDFEKCVAWAWITKTPRVEAA